MPRLPRFPSFLVPALFLLPLCACSHVFYQGDSELIYDPAKIGYSFENATLTSLDGTALGAWFFPAQKANGAPLPSKGLFVQFHGNAENRSTHFRSLAWVTREGYDLLAFDYRGYGGSAGRPDQRSVNQDALAAILWANQRAPRADQPRLILYGQSLGGAILMRALQDIGDPGLRANIRLVVADSTFYSYRAIARDILSRFWFSWWLQPLAVPLISDEYSPGDAIANIAPIPLVVVHGDEDGVIPLRFGEEIFARAREPKALWKVPGGHHIDAMDRPELRKRLISTLASGR